MPYHSKPKEMKNVNSQQMGKKIVKKNKKDENNKNENNEKKNKKMKNEMTLKEAINKFENMKDKPEPLNKPILRLRPLQKKLMVSHSEHHSKIHMELMKYLMTKEGYCFEQAHNITMKISGK